MNGRTARKLLRKNKSAYLFGKRSFVQALIPASIYPEPIPSFTPPGVNDSGFEGYWTRRDGDFVIGTHIGKISCSSDPRSHQDKLKPWKKDNFFFIEKDEYGVFNWWEIVEAVFKAEDFDKDPYGSAPVERRMGDPALIEGYRAQQNWISGYVHGDPRIVKWDKLPPLVQRLHMLGNYAKATFCDLESPPGFPDHIVLQWAVKYFYRNTFKRFANNLGHTVKAFKKADVPIRVR